MLKAAKRLLTTAIYCPLLLGVTAKRICVETSDNVVITQSLLPKAG